MDRERHPAGLDDGREHADALRAARVDDDARAERAGEVEAVDQSGEFVVGHGEQDEIGGRCDAGRLLDGDSGQQRLSPLAARLGHTADGDDVMPRLAQRRPQHRTDSPRTDDADAQARRTRERGRLLESHPPNATPVREVLESLRGRVLGEGCALVTRRGRPALDACVSGRSTGRGVARRAVSAGDSFRCAAGAQARGSRSIRCVSSRREQTRTIGS